MDGDRSTDEEARAHEIIALLFELIERGGRSFDEMATAEGLNPMQARAVLALREPLSMRAVAQQLRCDPSYVTEIADQLESRALLKRENAPSDRRVKLLSLTPRGLELRDRMRASFATTSPVMASLTSRERDQLRTILRKMTQGPEAHPNTG